APERARHLVGGPALAGHTCGDLGPDLVPDTLAARRGVGVQQYRRTAEHDRDAVHDPRGLVDLQPQLHAVAPGQPQAAQIDVAVRVRALGDVPRALRPGRQPGPVLGLLGLRRLGRPALLVVAALGSVVVLATAPSEHAHLRPPLS